MNLVSFINNILTEIIGIDSALISIEDIISRVASVSEWQRLFFDYQLIISLIIYFSLFYFVYYVLLKLPFNLFKKLIHQK